MSRRSQRALKKRVKTQRRNIKKVRNDNSGKKTSSKSLKNSMRKVTFSQFQTLMDDEYDKNFTGQNVNSSEIKDHRPDIDNDELSALIDTNTFKYAYITP